MKRCTIGIDIGTSSSKGVLVNIEDGTVVASAALAHEVQRPQPGWVEMDPELWWRECIDLCRQLLAQAANTEVIGVGVSGMGPCVVLTDAQDTPVRPAILYGVDTRAVDIADEMTAQLGAENVRSVGGSLLSSQSGGPKIRWVKENEPEAFARSRKLYMPASWLVRRLTGAYTLDHQSASQMSPLYDIHTNTWHEPWWDEIAGHLEPPTLAWASDIAGGITAEASAATGLREGTPVITGTIDAWSEAVSAGAHEDGDLMLMYGTTMFLISTGNRTLTTPSMWTTAGAFPGTRNLAGGLATSGALTTWIRDLTGLDYPELLQRAEESPLGANGLLMLPYFAGERTPIMDPKARGVIAGLTLGHTGGDLYRAALESTGFAVKHNVDTMRSAGADIHRIVAVGGGTQGRLWLQIISDVTGLVQQVPRVTLGASYGGAYMSASAVSEPSAPTQISDWNPIVEEIVPNPRAREDYDELFAWYLDLYKQTVPINHHLADRQMA